MEYKQENRLHYILIALIIMTIAGLSLFLPSDELKIGSEGILPLKDGWDIELPQETLHNMSLPFEEKVPVGEWYSASYRFDENLPSGDLIRIRASMQDIKVYLDHELVFDNIKPQSSYFELPNASVWHLIDLPEDLADKILRIEYRSHEEAFSGLINEVEYGRGDAIIGALLRFESPGILLSIVLSLMGIVMIAISYYVSHIGDWRFLYLGLFAITVSIWVLSEAKVMQLFTHSRFFIGGISYMMVALIPVSLTLYVKTAVLKHFQKLLNGIIIFFLADFFINIGLQLSGTMSFLSSLQVTNAMMLITLLILLICMMVEYRKNGNKEAYQFMISLGVLGIFVAFEIIQFFLQMYNSISIYIRIGLLMFFGILGIDSFKYMNQLFLKNKESEILKELVYRDMMTGGFNRTAFERDITLRKEEHFRLILLDLNDLKIINDTYGHLAGDEALIHVFNAISDVFKNYGTAYRLGGDEFACLIDPVDDEVFKELQEKFNSSLEKISLDLEYPLIVASGSMMYRGDDIDQFFSEVDREMYRSKQETKTVWS